MHSMNSAREQTKTLVTAVVLMVIAGFAPAIVLGAAGWANGANTATLAGLAVFIACIGGTGWRTGLLVAGPFAAFAGLGVWVAPNPWLAALVLAAAAFLRGYAARVGMHNALVMTVISLGFLVASPPQSDASIPAPWFVALVCFVSALWATLVFFLLRHRLHRHELTKLEPVRVLEFSLALALMVGVATWFVVDLELGHTGGWVILTIVVVAQPSLGAGFKKAAQRALGTVIGFVVAIGVGVLAPSGPLVVLLGSLFLMTAFVLLLQGRAYWIYSTFMTSAIVLLESSGSTVTRVAELRLEATLAGVAVTVVVMLALTPFSKRLTAAQPETIRATADEAAP